MTQILRENGVTNAILDLGGDIFAMGSKDGAGWLIGLASPRNADEICAKLRVSDMAIVTSGDYERYFMHENTRYHHIFDRRTGYPADSGIISATVIADSAMRADAMSTAIFVTGVPDMHIPHSDMRFIFIDSEMNITYSEDLNLEIVN
jgi:thiamine biosynthesis lipoprotein